MGKVLDKVFKTVEKENLQDLQPLRESSSQVFLFMPEPRKPAEDTKFSDGIEKPWIKATQYEIKNLV